MLRKGKLFASLLAFLVIGIAGATDARADSVIVGNANGNLATATVTNTSLVGMTFTFTLTNTSPFDARITGVGFDLPGTAGMFAGTSTNANFAFTNTDQQVPQFNNNTLDFAFLTGNNFSGGNPPSGLAPGQSATFTVTGPFGGLTAAQIEASIFVRFQSVGANGQLSDVGTPGTITNPIPEPTTMLLLGTGLAGVGVAVRRRRKTAAASSEE